MDENVELLEKDTFQDLSSVEGSKSPETVKKETKVMIGIVDPPPEETAELFALHDVTATGIVGRERYSRWSELKAQELEKEKPSLLVVRGLEPDASIEEILYHLPDNPSNMREAYQHDVYVAGMDISMDELTKKQAEEAMERLREHLAFNWDDPSNSKMLTKIESYWKGPKRGRALRFIAQIPLMKLSLSYQVGKQVINTGFFDLSENIADQVYSRIPAEVAMKLSRVKNFPFFGTQDLDFQHALVGLKISDFEKEFISQHEDITGSTIALIPGYEAKTKDVLNNSEEQEEIVRNNLRKYFTYYQEVAQGEEVADKETIDEVCKMVSAAIGTIQVRKITPMRPVELVKVVERAMPTVYDKISPTIERLVNEAAHEVLNTTH